MKQKVISTGYAPRPLQARVHKEAKRFTVVVCHRRFGKTVMALNHALDRGLRNERANPQYAYIAPFLSQARRVAWDYLKSFSEKIPGVTVNEADLRIDIPRPWLKDRVRIMLLGSDNPNALRGIYLDGVVCDEFGEWNPMAWREVIFPTLLDRQGWAMFLGTPKGQNAFYEVFNYARESGDPNWVGFLFKASETGVIPAEELAMAKAQMSIEEFEQEMECSFSAGMVGSIFGRQMAQLRDGGKIGTVPHDPLFSVDTFWDMGRDGMPVIFAQMIGGEPRIIDYEIEIGADLGTMAKLILSKPYVYGEHVLPHDGRARSLDTGKSRQETLQSLGLRNVRILEKHAKADSINAARVTLPRCRIDRTKCEDLIKALDAYQWKWDEQHQIFSQTPLHNWASHGADAFQTLALGIQEPHQRHFPSDLPQGAVTDFDVFSL